MYFIFEQRSSWKMRNFRRWPWPALLFGKGIVPSSHNGQLLTQSLTVTSNVCIDRELREGLKRLSFQLQQKGAWQNMPNCTAQNFVEKPMRETIELNWRVPTSCFEHILGYQGRINGLSLLKPVYLFYKLVFSLSSRACTIITLRAIFLTTLILSWTNARSENCNNLVT